MSVSTGTERAPNLALPALALTSLALGAPAIAYADDQDGVYVTDPALEPDEDGYLPELRSAPRLALGFDAGIGSFACQECDEDRFTGLSVDLFAGAMVAPRIALLAQAWGIVTFRPEGSRNAGWIIVDFNTVDARVWLTPTVWLDAGVGPGLLVSSTSGEFLTEVAPAFALAVGTEVEHKPDRAIDLQVRLGYAAFADDSAGHLWTVAAAVGLHLF